MYLFDRESAWSYQGVMCMCKHIECLRLCECGHVIVYDLRTSSLGHQDGDEVNVVILEIITLLGLGHCCGLGRESRKTLELSDHTIDGL